jgi:hypothetical protein
LRLLQLLEAQILGFDRQIMAWHRSNETNRRLDHKADIQFAFRGEVAPTGASAFLSVTAGLVEPWVR